MYHRYSLVTLIGCLLLLSACLLLLSPPPPAAALPGFARKTGLACSGCHNAWPMLNAMGRKFKENGYKLDRAEPLPDADHQKAEKLSLYKFTPLSGRVKGYVADHTKGGTTNVSPFHEAEMYLAGNLWDKASYFVEFEGEDEDDWEMLFEMGIVGLHPVDEFNLILGRGFVFFVDPYQSLADGGKRLTRARPAVSDRSFVTAQRFRDPTNQITAYGRLGGRVLYEAGVTTGSTDAVGSDKKDFMGRVAFDLTKDFMIGGYFWGGNTLIDKRSLSFSRGGVDFQYQRDDFSVFGAYLSAGDDLRTGTGSEQNNALSFTGLYSYRIRNRPVLVPIVRFDSFTSSDGKRRTTNGTLNFTYYPLENLNVSAEYFANLDTPAGVAKSWRFTVLFNALF